jgi:NAD(P)-dependent dehydrogenase (short-subunit alcohol dehydrogenase family)
MNRIAHIAAQLQPATTSAQSKTRVAVIGHSGTIGAAIVRDLSSESTIEIITASRSTGDFNINVSDTQSVADFYAAAGPLDAVISCSGGAHWGSFAELTKDKLQVGWDSKAGGQMDLVLQGKHLLRPGGVFILTTGFLWQTPLKDTAAVAAVNGALHSFCKTAAMELMSSNLRIMCVSPGFVKESKYPASLRGGLEEIAVESLASAYRRALVSGQTGKVIEATAGYVKEF